MRPWRDIPSVQEFRASLQTADPLDVAWAGLAGFRQAIEFYHNVPKRDINTLQQRQGMLLGISDRAGEYLVSIGVDLNAPGEAGIRRTNKNGITQVTDVSFRRNLLTYHRRARRKARYLEQLRAYCQNTGPDELIALVEGTVERDLSDGLLDMTHEGMAERHDFLHRTNFLDGALAEAFNDYLGSDQAGQMHFFLWLEEHPISVTQDRTSQWVYDIKLVHYVGEGDATPDRFKFAMLAFDDGILKCGGQPIDTYAAQYRGGRAKSIAEANQWGRGLAAFVWSAQNELFIAEHTPDAFHHSSFAAGDRVRCAGMIGIRAGRIEELSNNSGHYHPRKEHVRNFAEHFRIAFAMNHTILVLMGGDPQQFQTVDSLCQVWNYNRGQQTNQSMIGRRNVPQQANNNNQPPQQQWVPGQRWRNGRLNNQ